MTGAALAGLVSAAVLAVGGGGAAMYVARKRGFGSVAGPFGQRPDTVTVERAHGPAPGATSPRRVVCLSTSPAP
ncbi:MAG: hypothetical protein M0026_02490 [Nocardiopsaceae bacterium]|nr:hypothetical protein [Nocardiopsaceae bacterium]